LIATAAINPNSSATSVVIETEVTDPNGELTEVLSVVPNEEASVDLNGAIGLIAVNDVDRVRLTMDPEGTPVGSVK
jgi:hypothetical protein